MTVHHHSHTRAAYDAIAVPYAERFATVLEAQPFDRATLTAFAELARERGGPVLDAGSGPGRVTAYLHALGVDIGGLDLSPAMVALASATFPGLSFTQGTMTALPCGDGTLAGLVAWYSIIHTPRAELPALFAEFHRALAPGGHLLLGFQVGDEPLHLAEAFGHRIDLDFHRLDPAEVTGLLAGAGLRVTTTLHRDRAEDETASQAHLVARKP